MGNNFAFSAFEAAVIATYNKGVLDKELLSDFMEFYRGMDIDQGGMEGTLSKDGLNVTEVVVKTFGYTLPKRPELPEKYTDWTDEQYDLNEKYLDELYKLFHNITDKFEWC